MKDGLLERIRGVGHWRVLLRPAAPLPDRLSYATCQALVAEARVAIRGWDYPHMSRRTDMHGGEERAEGYFENWCDWNEQVEFWRMYRSGQFLSYNAVDDARVGAKPDARRLDVLEAIYAVTEFVEFAFRLAADERFHEGLTMEVSLNGADGRYLEAGRGRMPFLDFPRSDARAIRLERSVRPGAPGEDPAAVSNSMLMELFDAFGWHPGSERIGSDQEAFLRRDFR